MGTLLTSRPTSHRELGRAAEAGRMPESIGQGQGAPGRMRTGSTGNGTVTGIAASTAAKLLENLEAAPPNINSL